jgi:hypothetical protein
LKKAKQSEVISTFLKLVDTIQKEYETAYEIVSEKDKELTDITHKAELNSLKQNEKAKLMTELQHNRRERRYWKNKVDEFAPLHELMSNSKEFKSTIAQLKQVLGKVRKAEEYLENRTYKPRAKKNQ